MFIRKKTKRTENPFNGCPYWIRVFLKAVLEKDAVYSDADDAHFQQYSEFILQFVDCRNSRNNTWQFRIKPKAREYFITNPQCFDDVTDDEIQQHARKTDRSTDPIDRFSTEFDWWYYSNEDYIEIKPYEIPRTMRLFSRRQLADTHSFSSYCIDEDKYEHIIEIIENCCTAMERTPRSFVVLEEEQIRDHILSTLSTHYDNPTGETFRGQGKTDICIQFENKAAYIAECKIWHGEKAFLKAIEQLFSYTTWRDTKVSMVVFNKTNKSFDKLIDVIQSVLKNRAKSIDRIKRAQWRCIIQNLNREHDMLVTVQVFDLYA